MAGKTHKWRKGTNYEKYWDDDNWSWQSKYKNCKHVFKEGVCIKCKLKQPKGKPNGK